MIQGQGVGNLYKVGTADDTLYRWSIKIECRLWSWFVIIVYRVG